MSKEEILHDLDDALEAQDFRTAILCRLRLARVTADRLMELAAKAAQSEKDTAASKEQAGAIMDSVHALEAHAQCIEEYWREQPMSNETARVFWLGLNFGTAIVFADATEMGWPGLVEYQRALAEAHAKGGKKAAEAARIEREKMFAAYRTIAEANPALEPKEIAARLHEQFPERKLQGILTTVYGWQRGPQGH